MSDTIEVRVPDIGDFNDVPVIEVLVKPGDRIKKEDPLVTLESDKASMEVPSSAEGVVKDVKVKAGDKVSQGALLVTVASEPLETSAPPSAQPFETRPADAPQDDKGDNPVASSATAPVAASSAAAEPRHAEESAERSSRSGSASTIELLVPDIGDFKDIEVIDVLVKAGDRIEKEAALVTLESEKASMDVPASASGTIKDVRVKAGDKVSQGTVIAMIEPFETRPADAPQDDNVGGSFGGGAGDAIRHTEERPQDASRNAQGADGLVHASPAIRRFARELGVDLHGVEGSGPHGRVTREDVQRWIKSALKGGATPSSAGGFGMASLPAWPKVDFAQFGSIERKPLPRIKKISGPNLHRNWLQIPHITNYDEADVTGLEAFRNEVNSEQTKSGGSKLTMLAFLVKACVAALQRFPEFNASLEGDELVYKRYFNIGFAADTPSGLIVPVLKNAENKGLLEVARESAELAGKARDGKLGLGDMQGGSFTISSIGGIGGTAFTQIVNAPEVAILGATRAVMKPVWNGKEFEPHLLLPISVSYDHRVIDGAGAARFLVYLAGLLKDFRRILL